MARTNAHPPSFENGEYVRTSPTQIAKYMACPRSWYYAKVLKLPEKVFKSQILGVQLHKELETYLENGQDLFGKVMRPAKKYFPEYGPGVIPEGDIEDPPLFAGGVRVIGYYDWVNLRDPRAIEIGDLKTRSSLKYKTTEEELEKDPQGIIYAAYISLKYKPQTIRFTHVYAQTQGKADADRVSVVAHIDEWEKRWLTVKQIVGEMSQVAKLPDAKSVPYVKDEKVCYKYGGCSFADVCPHSPTRRLLVGMFDDETPVVKAPIPPATEASWKFVECAVCSMPMTAMGKRPPGHIIDPALCPNVKSHEVAAAPSLADKLKASLAPLALATGVVPPDAPKSDPALAAEPLPTEAVEAPKKTRGRPKKQEVVEGEVTIPSSAQVTQAAIPLAPIVTEAPPVIQVVKSLDLQLYIDCAPVGRVFGTVDQLASDYAAKVAKVTGCTDIRLSDHELLKFGKWKGALATVVREHPPVGEIVAFTSTGDLTQAVIEALIPLAKNVVRKMG